MKMTSIDRLLLLLTGVLVFRAFHLQVLRYDHYRTISDENRIQTSPIAPNRGLILDRNGVVLARNYSAYTLELFPAKVPDMDRTIQELIGQGISLEGLTVERNNLDDLFLKLTGTSLD